MSDADVCFYIIRQGSDWEEQVDLCNDDDSIIDISGCSAELRVVQTLQNQTVLLDLSTAAGTLVLDGPAGQINWAVPAVQTATLQGSPGLLPPVFGFDPSLVPFGFYSLRVKWPSGQLVTELTGVIALSLCATSTF